MSNKVGRPSDYRPEYCEVARNLLKEGCCKVEIAYELDVNISTLNRWIEQFPEFRNAIEGDASFAEGWWMKEGKANLANGRYNTRMYELQMMNRFGWKKNAETKNEQNVSVELKDAKEKVRDADQQY